MNSFAHLSSHHCCDYCGYSFCLFFFELLIYISVTSIFDDLLVHRAGHCFRLHLPIYQDHPKIN